MKAKSVFVFLMLLIVLFLMSVYVEAASSMVEISKINAEISQLEAKKNQARTNAERGKYQIQIDLLVQKREELKRGAVGLNFSPVWPVPDKYTVSALARYSSGNYHSAHYGSQYAMDIPAGKGTPVVAAESGTVITAGASGGGLGNRIIIQHNDQNKTQSLYAHLNSIEVRVSTQVQRGQRIGTVGATGNVTGPHLHFEFSNRRPYHDIYRSRYNNIRLSEAAARFPQ